MSESPERLISWRASSNFPHHLSPCFLLFSLWGLKRFFFNFYLLSPPIAIISHCWVCCLSPPTPPHPIPPSLLKSLRTSASWLCLSLISFCQAFVFDHRSSVSTLLLLLSTSFPPPTLFTAYPYWCVVCVCAYVCTWMCAFFMYRAQCIFVGISAYGRVSLCALCMLCKSRCANKNRCFYSDGRW